jgi:hypothetical protein
MLQATAPTLLLNDHVGERGAAWLGALTDIRQFSVITGNKSGTFNNADFNKYWVLVDVANRLTRVGLFRPGVDHQLEDLHLAMAGDHPRLLLHTRGDNIRIFTKTSEDSSLASKAMALEAGKLPTGFIYPFSEDPYASFDGWISVTDGTRTWAEPDLDNFLRALLVPEYDWARKFAPSLGLYERLRRAMTATAGPSLIDMTSTELKPILGKDLMSPTEDGRARDLRRLGALAMTAMDIEVADDPSKISWKFDPSMISANLREALLTHVPLSETTSRLAAWEQHSKGLTYT